MTGAPPARLGLLPLLRVAALPLALFWGLAHLIVAAVLTLMVLGVIADGIGGALLLILPLSSLLASVVLYYRMEERQRSRASSLLVVSGIQTLASRVIELYPRPVHDPHTMEVFELYRRAQASLEHGDYGRGGEIIERGIELADELLSRDGEPPYADDPARTREESSRGQRR